MAFSGGTEDVRPGAITKLLWPSFLGLSSHLPSWPPRSERGVTGQEQGGEWPSTGQDDQEGGGQGEDRGVGEMGQGERSGDWRGRAGPPPGGPWSLSPDPYDLGRQA